MSELRVLIADDHTLVRHGLRKILEERPTWRVIAEVGDGREAIRQCAALEPDIAIIDVSMPVLNGIDATQQIVRHGTRTRVLLLSMHADEAYVIRALQCGASGYLLKDSAGKELIDAVASIAKGDAFFSPPVARTMLEDYVRRSDGMPPVDRFDTLSPREREVLQLIAEARTNKEIAQLLAISLATVETHRARLLQKLNIRNAAELVLYATRRGIIA
jgi:two-component system, NarL family, response regulator NreC